MGEDTKRRRTKKQGTTSQHKLSRRQKTFNSLLPLELLIRMTKELSQEDRGINRTVRDALRNQDVTKLKSLLNEGVIAVNLTIDNTFFDTPLMYAVKHSSLEVVEMLLNIPDCKIDCRDRNRHTALDEAIKVWLIGGGMGLTEGHKQHRGRRFRVVRCILAKGAQELSPNFLDGLVYSCHNSRSGMADLEKLVRVVCLKGHTKVKSIFLSVLASHAKMTKYIHYILASGADPLSMSVTKLPCQHINEDNAIVIIKATNHSKILQLIEQYLNIPQAPDRRSFRARPINRAIVPFKHTESIRLLILSGHLLSLKTMDYLRKNQAGLYKLAAGYVQHPLPLKYIARVTVRQQCYPNVIAAITHIKSVPLAVRQFLVFDELS